MSGVVTVSQCFVPKSREDEEEIERCFKEYTEKVLALPKEKSWVNDKLMYEYRGCWFQSNFGLEGVLWMQDHFDPKPTDIFLMTYPKCGTTWLKALIFSIMRRTQFDFSTHPLLKHNPHELVPYLEFELFQGPPLGDPEILPSPRILASHLPYTLLPKPISDSSCKMVYICRDPKDTFVSTWHFVNKFRAKLCGLAPVSLEEALDFFCRGVTPQGSYWDHVLGYWRVSLERPENVLFFRYEAMKEDVLGHVTKLAEFLDCPFIGEEEDKNILIQEEIAKLCSFESLSNLEVNKTGSNIFNLDYNSFFRTGKVGDSKNYLTYEMAEHIDKVTEQKLNGTGFTFYV